MKTKLKTLLIGIICCFIFVPVIVLLSVGKSTLSRFSRSMIEEEIGVLSYSKSAGIEDLFSFYKSELSSAAALDGTVQTVRGLYADNKERMDSYINTIAQNNEYILDVAVTDINGVVIADFIGRDVGSLFSGYVTEFTELGKNDMYLSDVYFQHSDYGKQDIFLMTKPIYYEDEAAGYISFTISVNAFNEILESGRLFERGQMFIVDSKGNAIGMSSVSAVRFEELGDSKLQAVISDIKTTVKNSNVPYEKFNTTKRTGVFGAISDVNWHWIGSYPSSEITMMFGGYYLACAIVILGIAVACVLIMLYLSHIAISPMHEMIATMELLNSGNLDARFDFKGHNEYSRMSKTFNTLIDEVIISEELHRTISNISDNILFEWDFQKEAMFVSDNFINLFDIDCSQSTLRNGKFIDSLMEDEDKEKYKRDINKLLKTKSKIASEYQIKTKQNIVIWYSLRAQCVTDRLGEVLRVIGVITNIDNEKRLTLQLSERASYDFLSKLYNRNTFMRELQMELDRDANAKYAVVFIDVDDFKTINDRYGHSVGDEVIKHVSTIIKAQLKNNGFAGRFGGDEFVMCVTNPEAVSNIETMVSELIDIYDEGYYSEQCGIKIKIKISIGISKAPEHGRDSEMLIAAADDAMYYVKKNGKSNYHIYNPEEGTLVNMMHTM